MDCTLYKMQNMSKLICRRSFLRDHRRMLLFEAENARSKEDLRRRSSSALVKYGLVPSCHGWFSLERLVGSLCTSGQVLRAIACYGLGWSFGFCRAQDTQGWNYVKGTVSIDMIASTV